MHHLHLQFTTVLDTYCLIVLAATAKLSNGQYLFLACGFELFSFVLLSDSFSIRFALLVQLCGSFFLRNYVIHTEKANLSNHDIINPVDPQEKRKYNLLASLRLKHTKIILNVPKNKKEEIAHYQQSISPGKGHGMPMSNAQKGLRQDCDEVTDARSKVLHFLG